MSVLIVGAGGQVGRALLRAVPVGVVAQGLTHTELDITDGVAVARAFERHGPQCVLNAAAYTAVDAAENDRAAAQAGNVTGARTLAEAAARLPTCRLVHVSTDFVFDGTASTPYAPAAVPNPLGVYGATKLAGERAVLAALGERAVVVRTAWVYSADGRNFLTTMLRLMKEKKPLRVVADQVGTPTSADSLAAALWQCATRVHVHGVLHFTDAGVASWYDFAQAIAEEGAAAGLLPRDIIVTPIATAEYPTAARRPAYSVLDQREAQIALGLNLVHWRERLRAVLAGMRQP